MLLKTAITVISFGIHSPNFEHLPITSDVYRVVSATSTTLNREPREISYAGTALLPTTFIGNAMPSVTSWGMPVQATSPVNSIHLAFESVGVSRVEGDHLLTLAKGILAEMKYFDVVITPSIVHDPEENSSYLTLRLHVDADFESTLKLDSCLTKELVARTNLLPEKLSFAVYELG